MDNSLILSNADFLLHKGANVIFRIPVIPGVNTGEEELNRIIHFIRERNESLEEVHLLPYHRIAENKYSKLKMENLHPETKEPDKKEMRDLKRQFQTAGVEIVIGG